MSVTTTRTDAADPTREGRVGGASGRLGRTLVEDARRFAVRNPVLVDLLLALAVVALSIVGEGFDLQRTDQAVAFDVLLGLPLLARRRWPTPVFLVIAAVALVQWSVGVQAHADSAVLLALYAVGAYEPRRQRVALAAGTAQLGVVLATVRWAPEGHETGAFLLLSGTVAAAWVGGSWVRTRRAYLSAVLERAATAERDRDQQAQIAVAGERSRIAREMHDVVAHGLSVMIALSDGAAAAAGTEPEATREAAQQASAVGRESLGEMRRLLGVLRADDSPELLPQPTDGQLDDLVERTRLAGLPVELTVSGRPPRSSPGAQLAVHRIVQESLTNVLKHAPGARHTLVRVDYRPGGIDVEVTNDDPLPHGAGEPRPGTPAGHGLVGMHERAALFGGSVRAGRGDDGSWRVSTRLRLDDAVALR